MGIRPKAIQRPQRPNATVASRLSEHCFQRDVAEYRLQVTIVHVYQDRGIGIGGTLLTTNANTPYPV